MEPSGTILAVWAHPDDESFLCSGIMAAAVDEGRRVVCATATRGEAGSQDHERWPPEKMPEIRTRELEASLAVLGVSEHHWLGFVDGECDAIPHDDGVESLHSIFADVQPDTVLTFGPEGLTGHPDHVAVSEWTSDAFDRWAPKGARLFYAIETTEYMEEYGDALREFNIWAPGTPPTVPRAELDICFDVAGDLLDRKMRALRAQVSQIETLFSILPPGTLEPTLEYESYRLARTK